MWSVTVLYAVGFSSPFVRHGGRIERCCQIGGGEQPVVEKRPVAPVVADTFAGQIQIESDGSATVTLLGQLPFFIEYLKGRPRVRNTLDPQCENYLAIHRAACAGT